MLLIEKCKHYKASIFDPLKLVSILLHSLKAAHWLYIQLYPSVQHLPFTACLSTTLPYPHRFLGTKSLPVFISRGWNIYS